MSRYALVYDKCQSFQKRTGIKLFIFLYTLWTNVPHIRWYCRYFHYISCVWCMNHLTSTYINTYMPNSYTNISWLWILTLVNPTKSLELYVCEYLPVKQKLTSPEQSKEFGPAAPHTYGFPSAEYARDTVLPDT